MRFGVFINGYIETVTGTLFFRSVFNGYIENLTGTLFFRSVFNGYTDSK